MKRTLVPEVIDGLLRFNSGSCNWKRCIWLEDRTQKGQRKLRKFSDEEYREAFQTPGK